MPIPDKENYGREFLYAEDLLVGQEYRTVTVEIASYHPENTLKTAAKKLIDKPAIGFAGKSKLLVLCKTNQSLIHFVTGISSEQAHQWVGQKIVLQPRIVDAFGSECVAVRVLPPDQCTIRKGLVKQLGRRAVWEGQKRVSTSADIASEQRSPPDTEQRNGLADSYARRIESSTTAAQRSQIAMEVAESFADGGLTQEEANGLTEKLSEK